MRSDVGGPPLTSTCAHAHTDLLSSCPLSTHSEACETQSIARRYFFSRCEGLGHELGQGPCDLHSSGFGLPAHGGYPCGHGCLCVCACLETLYSNHHATFTLHVLVSAQSTYGHIPHTLLTAASGHPVPNPEVHRCGLSHPGSGGGPEVWGQGAEAYTTVVLFLVTKAVGRLPGKCCGPSQCLGQPIAMETYIKDGQADLPNHRPIEITHYTKITTLNIKIYYVHTLNQKRFARTRVT